MLTEQKTWLYHLDWPEGRIFEKGVEIPKGCMELKEIRAILSAKAETHVVEPDDLESAREKYLKLFGSKPHGKMGLPNLLKEIEKREAELSLDNDS